MCGGFAYHEFENFTSRFRVVHPAYTPTPRYNIRPTMPAATVYVRDGERTIEDMRFGMIPVWAKDEKIGYKLFNARAETLFEKPSWKRSATSKRCIIPANGFYEWQMQSDGKHPQYIFPSDQKTFSFAGVYDHWTDKTSGEVITSFAIITTTPNAEMKPIHDRMPVVLNPETEDAWLGDENDEGFLRSLLTPYPNGILEHFEVPKLVNTAKNQGPEVIKPI